MGSIYTRQGKHQKALDVLHQAIQLNMDIEEEGELAKCYVHLAITYEQMGHWDEAHIAKEEALRLARAIQNPISEAGVLLNLANLHRKQDHFDNSLAYINKPNTSIERSRMQNGYPLAYAIWGDC